MTRKKGIALIICLTLIISMALPGTLAFSGDPSATNENLTLLRLLREPTALSQSLRRDISALKSTSFA